jgi:dipeptidase
MLRIKLSIYFLLTIWFSALSQQTETYNCYSILVGQEASANGAIMLAHNEDDWGERIVNWYKVPASHPSKQDSITLRRGAKVEPPKQTYAYLWWEMPGLEFSDTYFNENGIVITSDACPSKEDKAEINGGGIGYQLRRLMAERASSAREAVILGGALIERFGYISSGRTYCIAGPQEAWMLSVVKGKHWVARRIPENHVAIIPNYYTIGEVDLQDTLNYLGSKDLIDYAIQRGWYKPGEGKAFNFRKAYGKKESLSDTVNIARHWVILNKLAKREFMLNDEFPFSFIPREKVSLTKMFYLLRNHYEETLFDRTRGGTNGNPHRQQTMSVCSSSNQYGFVAELRQNLPPSIGNVIWMAPRRPCSEAFVPVYAGLKDIPKKWHYYDWKTALFKHFDEKPLVKNINPPHPHLIFDSIARSIDQSYYRKIGNRHRYIIKIESELLQQQAKTEALLLKLLKNNPTEAFKYMQTYTFGYLDKLLRN